MYSLIVLGLIAMFLIIFVPLKLLITFMDKKYETKQSEADQFAFENSGDMPVLVFSRHTFSQVIVNDYPLPRDIQVFELNEGKNTVQAIINKQSAAMAGGLLFGAVGALLGTLVDKGNINESVHTIHAQRGFQYELCLEGDEIVVRDISKNGLVIN